MVHKKGSWKRAFEWVGEIVGVFHESCKAALDWVDKGCTGSNRWNVVLCRVNYK